MKSFYPFETKLHNKKGILICGFLPSTVALLLSFVFWGGQHTTAPHAFGAVDNGHFSAALAQYTLDSQPSKLALSHGQYYWEMRSKYGQGAVPQSAEDEVHMVTLDGNTPVVVNGNWTVESQPRGCRAMTFDDASDPRTNANGLEYG